MNKFLKKLTSRKFIAALLGFIAGIIMALCGNTVEGATTAITSVVAYIAAEGYIDAKAVKQVAETVEDVATEVAAGVAAQVAAGVANNLKDKTGDDND